MPRKGEKMSVEQKVKLRKAMSKRWARDRKIREKIEARVEKKVEKAMVEKKTKEVVVIPETIKRGCVTIPNPAGQPLKPKMADIDIEKLPTTFNTSEQLRGYILAQTDGGRVIIDTVLADFRSKKSPKTLKRDLAKMLLDLITPEKGQKMEFGMESPDGKFVFRWQNEVSEENE